MNSLNTNNIKWSENVIIADADYIDKVAFSPEAPTSIAPVSVTATVSGLQAVTSATLNYNGNSVPMNGSGSQFTATIPAMADGTEVSFTVTVDNEAGFKTTSDKFTYKVGDPATDWTKLKFNEVYGAGADEEKFFESLQPTLSHLSLKAGYSLTADPGPSSVSNATVVRHWCNV